MKTWSWRTSSYSKSQVIVAAGLLMLLPLLAMMQYRLLGKVSEAERERRRASLQASADRFSVDFDQELIRAYSAFLIAQAPATNAGSLAGNAELARARPRQSPPTAIADSSANIPARAVELLNNAYNRWHDTTAYPRLIDGVYLVQWPAAGADAGS
ncbi:MAG: hypothetical protein ACKOB4_14275, partial [Acidobacteriota bacterium]